MKIENEKIYLITKGAYVESSWDSHDDVLGAYTDKETAIRDLIIFNRAWKLNGEDEAHKPKIIEMNQAKVPEIKFFNVCFIGNGKKIKLLNCKVDGSDLSEREEEQFKHTLNGFEIKFYITVAVPIEDEDDHETLIQKAINKVTKDGYQIIS